jgi:TonB-dependent receptor
MRLLQLFVILATTFSAHSQGVIRGKINDGQTGESLIGANAFIEGTTKGAMADLDGNFSLEGLAPGTYNIVGRFIGYRSHTQEVVITGTEVQVLQFNLFPETFVIEQAAEVVAKVDRARDTYMENIKKKSAASIDYISSQQIKRTGDNDAAAAMKRVSGVSTVGNFVFVRGLSDRYLKTTLNGAEVPSMNPRRNTIEMDLFPTNLVDNLKVVKTQTANLPSDWAGAYISVETKDFPDKFMFNYSSSLGWNTNTTGKELRSSQRGSKDWLGYDDGSRSLSPLAQSAAENGWPSTISVSFSDQIQYIIDRDLISSSTVDAALADCGFNSLNDVSSYDDTQCILAGLGYADQWGANQMGDSLYFQAAIPASIEANQGLTDIGKSFDNTWEHVRRTAAMDMKHSITFGNQTSLFGRQLGYTFGAQYARNTRGYQDGIYGRWAAGNVAGTDELDMQQRYTDERTNETHRWNTMLNLSYKLNEFNKVSLMGMTITNGTNSARFQEGLNPRDGDEIQQQRSHRYQSRTLNTFQMRGEHYLPDNALTIDWIASRSEGRMSTPDLRVLFNNYIDNTEVIADEAVFFDANGNTLDASASGDVLDEIEGLIDDGILDGNWAEDIAGTVETLQQEGIAIGDMEVPTETQRFYSIRPDRYPAPNRFWRALDETKTDVKVNFSKPVFAEQDHVEGKFSFGGSFVRTERTKQEDAFTFAASGQFFDNFEGSPSLYFSDPNLVVSQGGDFIQTNNVSNPSNSDAGFLNVLGTYAMLDARVNERLSGNMGLRMESASMLIESNRDTSDQTAEQLARNTGTLEETNLLPSLNLTYILGKVDPIRITNLRAAYSKTLARPVFREKAPFRGFDFETLQTLKGNPGLGQTRIDNVDLKLEHYPTLGEMVSAGVFYKHFADPIEQTQVLEAVNEELTWSNVPYADIMGIEFDAKKNLANVTNARFLRNLSLSGNVTFIRSAVKIPEAELESIRAQDPNHPNTRALFGQAPYIVNGIMTYMNDSAAFVSTLSFNVQGPKVFLVTQGALPNVMQQPTPTLDFSMAKGWGAHFKFGFKARNLLNPRNRQTHLFNGVEYDWSSFTRGRTYSVSLSYSI